jgi:hypothetical protein
MLEWSKRAYILTALPLNGALFLNVMIFSHALFRHLEPRIRLLEQDLSYDQFLFQFVEFFLQLILTNTLMVAVCSIWLLGRNRGWGYLGRRFWNIWQSLNFSIQSLNLEVLLRYFLCWYDIWLTEFFVLDFQPVVLFYWRMDLFT